MIDYVSTRDTNIRVRSGKAVLDGQASGGGLYVPEKLDDLKIDYHDAIKGGFRDMAEAVWKVFFDDYGDDLIDALVERSYEGKFSVPEITPLVKVKGPEKDAHVLELYHGPTSAFKDVALSALPNLL